MVYDKFYKEESCLSASRIYDGLVGYFDRTKDAEKTSSDGPLDLDTCFTYFPRVRPIIKIPTTSTAQPPVDNDPTQLINQSNFPSIPAYHVHPKDHIDASTFARAHYDNLNVFGGIIDPFNSIHIYTADLLPTQSLQLLPWTVKAALEKMTPFFRVGPILSATDLPKDFKPDYHLQADYDFSDPTKSPTVPGPGLQLPTVAVGDWRWLQPFVVQPSPPKDAKNNGDLKTKRAAPPMLPPETHFNAFATVPPNMTPQFQNGPYTALEGYLQLAEPITKPAGPAATAPAANTPTAKALG